MQTDRPSDQFVALGHAGSEYYAGLETFSNPGVSRVEITSDELAAVCSITGQPDLYTATIEFSPEGLDEVLGEAPALWRPGRLQERCWGASAAVFPWRRSPGSKPPS